MGAAMAARELGVDLRHEWAIDYDPMACKTYGLNILGDPEDPRVKNWDIREKDWVSGKPYEELGPVDIFAFGFPCFVAGTLVTTLRGAVPIESVEVGEMVLTHRGAWRKVVRVMSRLADHRRDLRTPGMMVPLGTTDEHPFYARLASADPDWVEARALTPCTKQDPSGHMLSRARRVQEMWPAGFFDPSLFDNGDFWYLLGVFLGDGRVSVRKNRKGETRHVIRVRRHDHHIKPFRKTLQRLGYESKLRDERGISKVEFTCEKLGAFLASLGDKPHQRLLPGWCLSAKKEQLERLLDGWVDSCGSFINRRVVCVTSSLALAVEMARVAEMVRNEPSCVYRQSADAPSASGEYRHRYQVHMVSDRDGERACALTHTWFAVRDTERVEGEFQVFNLEVEEDNSYHANGYCVHNCNDFSLIGKQKGLAGEFGPLYTYAADVLKHYEPVAFVAENVGGLTSSKTPGGESAFEIISKALGAGGHRGGPEIYNVTVHLYKAEEYGVPQTRHRVIFVGTHKEKHKGKGFRVPAPTTKDRYLSVSEAFADIPADAPNNEFRKNTQRVIDRLSHIPEGGNAWSEEIPPEHRLKETCTKLSQTYRRLDRNKPSYTLTANGGGGSKGYHWEENRELTNREKARIQSFPNDFYFYGSLEQVRTQIGMAVPPLLAKHIFEALFKTLKGDWYEGIVDPNLHGAYGSAWKAPVRTHPDVLAALTGCSS